MPILQDVTIRTKLERTHHNPRPRKIRNSKGNRNNSRRRIRHQGDMMEITIVDKHENPYLFRTEVSGKIKFTGPTPSYNELKKVLAEQLKVAEQTIAILHIYTKFGAMEADFAAHAYQTAEHLAKTEPKVKEKKTPEKK